MRLLEPVLVQVLLPGSAWQLLAVAVGQARSSGSVLVLVSLEQQLEPVRPQVQV